jgi:hypothetical protein
MEKKLLKKIATFVEANIQEFHQKRLDNLLKLKLETILKRKNPYLFKAKNLVTAHDLVKSLLDAHLSSQEETIFGDFLEKLARFVSENTIGAKKSSAEGIDLEFEKNDVIYLVSIKSGPNWGNSSQIRKMITDFKKAKKVLGTNSKIKNIIAINGCCYGKDHNPNKGDYYKYCGQKFWEFISGDSNLYIDIIEPLGYKAKEKNENFKPEYVRVINKFTKDFLITYCDKNGNIFWNKLVQLSSAIKK